MTVKANGRQPFDVGLMSPLRTMDLIFAAGLLFADQDLTGDGVIDRNDAFQAYRQDRGVNRPWNDQWGNPLLVSYALFQPERYQCLGDNYADRPKRTTNHRGLMLQAAKTHYGFNRSLYLVLGSLGGTLPENVKWTNWPQAWPATDDLKVLRTLWCQVRRVCRAHEWNEDAQAGETPPKAGTYGEIRVSAWDDYRIGTEGDVQCLITRPYEVQ